MNKNSIKKDLKAFMRMTIIVTLEKTARGIIPHKIAGLIGIAGVALIVSGLWLNERYLTLPGACLELFFLGNYAYIGLRASFLSTVRQSVNSFESSFDIAADANCLEDVVEIMVEKYGEADGS